MTQTTTSYIGRGTFKHELKCWPNFFTDLSTGRKTHETRFDDRAYEEGHVLVIREWCEKTETYTGNVLEFNVTHVLRNWHGLAPGWVVMSLQRKFV